MTNAANARVTAWRRPRIYSAPLSAMLASCIALCGPTVATASNGATVATQGEDSAAQALATTYRAEAETAFVEGDFEGAVEAFERAHETSPHPTDLFNLGRVREEQGELDSALAYYEEFAALPRLSLNQRQAAAERIEVLRRIVAPPPTAPGPVTTGQSDASVQRDRSRPLIITGAVLAGVGTALAVSGGVGFGLVARRNTDEIDRVSDGQNPNRLTLSETEELHARGQNAEALQITFLAAGSAVALLGVGILAAGLVNRKRTQNTAVVPVAGPRFAGMSARFSF